MKLSILVPVYNVEKYLKRCLDSIYAQLDSQDEIVIVDDGSIDRSGSICDEYRELYPSQTFVYHKDNQGAYPTRNYALDRCSGDYIWLVDPDDYIERGIIKKIKEVIISENEPDVLSLAYKRFSNKGFQRLENSFDNVRVSGIEFLKKYVPNPYLWSHVYNKVFLRENDIRFSDQLNTQGDWLFNMVVNINAETIVLTNLYAYNYYVDNPTSTLKNMSIAHRIRCVNNSLLAIDEFQRIISNCNNSELIKSLKNFQSLNLAGFIFSLYQLNMSVGYVRQNIIEIKKRNLYPVNFCSYNKKANLFIWFMNKYQLFLFICRMRNLFKKEMKIIGNNSIL